MKTLPSSFREDEITENNNNKYSEDLTYTNLNFFLGNKNFYCYGLIQSQFLKINLKEIKDAVE